jgi:hypothetical protein
MTDRDACVWNLVDEDIQRDADNNNGVISPDAVACALYKAYDCGARERNPDYAEMSSILRNLSALVGKVSNFDSMLYSDMRDLITELEDELQTAAKEPTNNQPDIINNDAYNLFW